MCVHQSFRITVYYHSITIYAYVNEKVLLFLKNFHLFPLEELQLLVPQVFTDIQEAMKKAGEVSKRWELSRRSAFHTRIQCTLDPSGPPHTDGRKKLEEFSTSFLQSLQL